MRDNLDSGIDNVHTYESVKPWDQMTSMEKYLVCSRMANAIEALHNMRMINLCVKEYALHHKAIMVDYEYHYDEHYYRFDEYDNIRYDDWDRAEDEIESEWYMQSNRDKARDRARRNKHKGCQCSVMGWKSRMPRFK